MILEVFKNIKCDRRFLYAGSQQSVDEGRPWGISDQIFGPTSLLKIVPLEAQV